MLTCQTNNLKEEGFIRACGFRDVSSPWRGGAEKFISWQPGSKERKTRRG
jgi:hypothetical protein